MIYQQPVSRTPQTLTEKIVQRHSINLPPGKVVRSGDYVSIKPHQCMTHDNTWPVAQKFMSVGASSVFDRKQLVMTLDHDVQNKSEQNLKKYRLIREFAKEHGVDFYPAGRGIGHQIMVEEGYAWPGTLAVASDSHSNMYGGLGCLGTAIVRTDAASIWALGQTWWKIPPIAKVTFTGTLPKGVTGKDVIVALCGLFGHDEVLNHAIEFTGPPETMASLEVDDRLAIANMTTEWGAVSGLFPIDSVLERWLRAKTTESTLKERWNVADTNGRFQPENVKALYSDLVKADPGAQYAKHLYLDLSTLSPYVSGPNSVKVATPLEELAAQNIKVDRAYLVSCTNSRASDLAAAAKVFKDAAAQNEGKIPKIADGVHFYIAAASIPEQLLAEAEGDWQAMIEAGAQPLPAGCGPCIGLGTGLLQPGEVGISASNRNFKGRMGSTDAKAYLASPEVVAASALAGTITGPGLYEKPTQWDGVRYGAGTGAPDADRIITADKVLEAAIGNLDDVVAQGEQDFGAPDPAPPPSETAPTATVPGFPQRIAGEIVFCDADNINTDGIYPGRLTYQDDVTRAQMAAACMQNYDPAFAAMARDGDILVAGFNFGCGSSREQAATALLARGIPLVVSGSFGSIFARNSINNALMGLEVPRLVERLRQRFGAAAGDKAGGGETKQVVEPEGNKESLDSPPPGPVEGPREMLTRRTGWRLTWDVTRSRVEVQEGEGGETWTESVGDVPPTVQEIIAKGGLEKWIKSRL